MPVVRVGVVGAEVTVEGFRPAMPYRPDELIDGLGDAAGYDRRTASLHVLVGTVVFSATVLGHRDALAVATALAHRATARLRPGPRRPAGGP
jgi:hypothetical protein